MDHWLVPGHRVDVEEPQITQTTPAHATVDHQTGFARRAIGVGDSGVRFSGGWRVSMRLRHVPGCLAVGKKLECVQIVEISRYIVLRVVAVVRETSKEEDPVADEGETVSQSRTRGWLVLRRLRLQAFPFPSARLELVQLVRVLAIFHHSAKDQDTGAVDDESVCRATWRDISLRGWHEPLVCGCKSILNVYIVIYDILFSS